MNKYEDINRLNHENKKGIFYQFVDLFKINSNNKYFPNYFISIEIKCNKHFMNYFILNKIEYQKDNFSILDYIYTHNTLFHLSMKIKH